MLSAMSLMTAARHNVLKVVDFITVSVHVQLQVAGRVLGIGALSAGNK